MMLSDVRDYVESLELADQVYMGSLPDKRKSPLEFIIASISRSIRQHWEDPSLRLTGQNMSAC